jgi:CheY-like chemotaxis protein
MCPRLIRDLVWNREGRIALWCNSARPQSHTTIQPGHRSVEERTPSRGVLKSKLKSRILASLATKKGSRSGRPSKRAKSKVRNGKTVGTTRPGTVLVVDDDPSVLRALNRLISASGFTVKMFAKPSELIASEIPTSNACMVVDVDMPEMTGIEMCEVLKGSGRGLPAILITGRTDTRTRLQAAQSNAVAVLFKPFNAQPLLDAISRALALSTRNPSGV